jgi:hypothetical protein
MTILHAETQYFVFDVPGHAFGRLSADSASEWLPNEKYGNLGWESYLNCRHHGNDESCKKERERWWERKLPLPNAH